MSHHTDHTSSRKRRGIVAGAALVTAGVLVALSAPTAAVAADPVATTIDLYDVNDFHGRLEPDSGTLKQGSVAGAATLSGAVEQLMAKNPASAFVSAGDNVGASTFTSFVQDDQPTIDALNAAGLSVSAIGNHELDRGQDDLRNRIIGADGARNAEFDYISSNIVTANGTPAFQPWSIKEIGGVRVGFIGATTELIPELVSPAGIAGLHMADTVDTVNRYADALTDGDPSNGEADALVLLVHEGAANASLASSTDDSDFGHIATGVSPKVSVIFSAHTHQLYDHDVVPTGGTVPRPVIQTGSYGTYLGHATLTIDPVTRGVTAATAENIPLAANGFPSDPAVAEIVAKAKSVADQKGKVVLGSIDRDMLRAKQTNGSENRGGESTLGNFIAEMQRSATERNGAQLALMNPGGLRDDLRYAASGNGDLDGQVTYQEAAAVQPFANTLVVEDLTGDQIRRALEQQWQPAGAGRPFLKLGVSKGFSYTYDPTAAAGGRIGTMTLDGEPVDLDATYKVTVNSFLASGGDNFTALNEAVKKADSGQVDLQAQVDFFTANPAVTVDGDQRAVGATVTPTPEGGFQPGDEVSVALSSLTFSNAGDQAGDVSVSAGDTVLATSPIDTTIVDTTDEQGRATLTFTVPEADTTGDVPTARAAAAPTATTDEPLVVTLPNGQTVALGTTIPVPAAVTDPTDPTDPGADPTDPGTDPSDPGATPGAGDGAGGDDGAGGGAVTDDGTPIRDGALAFTGGTVAAPAIAAGLLLAAGVGIMLLRRRRARQRAAGDLTD